MLKNFNIKYFKPAKKHTNYSWSQIEGKKQDIYLLEQDGKYAKLLLISPNKEMLHLTLELSTGNFVEQNYYSPEE